MMVSFCCEKQTGTQKTTKNKRVKSFKVPKAFDLLNKKVLLSNNNFN